MIDAIIAIFEMCFSTSYGFLTLNLEGYSPTVSAVMETLNGTFQAIGYSLLVILTLWNIVHTSTSYVELKKPEVLGRIFIRFILTKYVIGYAWTLVNQVFSLFASLTSTVFSTSGFSNSSWNITRPEFETGSFWSDLFNEITKYINPLSQIPSLLLSIIAFIVALVLAVTLILTVIGRFFKIYLFSALAPLPLATFGSQSTQDIGRSFLKSLLAVSVEGLVIGLSMIIFSAYLQMPNIFAETDIFSWLGATGSEMAYSFSLIFDMMLFLSIVKGTDRVVQKIFGI